MVSVGVISDTHDLLRPEAVDALAGSDLILHAGDVVSPGILASLEKIAPTKAVRGNNDRGAWAGEVPENLVLQIEGVRLLLVHDRKTIDLDPLAAGFNLVISGHSHRPSIERRGGVLYLNPGSAGPRRFSLPIAVARIRVDGTRLRTRVLQLDCRSPKAGRPPG